MSVSLTLTGGKRIFAYWVHRLTPGKAEIDGLALSLGPLFGNTDWIVESAGTIEATGLGGEIAILLAKGPVVIGSCQGIGVRELLENIQEPGNGFNFPVPNGGPKLCIAEVLS